MMDVIIVAKTRMKDAACVGGVLDNGRFVRLLDSNGYNHDYDTDLNIGEVYRISFSESENKIPPHIEDILVDHLKYKHSFSSEKEMVDYLINELKIKIWRGDTEKLFDGKLNWTNGGSGYISKNSEIPENSVGFWVPDTDLKRKDFNDKVRYTYYPIKWRNITFVGFQTPVDEIPAGTLVRVSLARWWSPNEDEQDLKCYLQLSGWYNLDLPEEDNDPIEKDLPF